MTKLALYLNGIESFQNALNYALNNEFDMIVVPLNPTGISFEDTEIDFLYGDLVLSPDDWQYKVVLTLTASNYQLCNAIDQSIRERAEKTLREELAMAFHFQNGGVKLIQLNGNDNINLARIVSENLEGHLLAQLPLCNPFKQHNTLRNDIDCENETSFIIDTWHWWHEFHSATDYNSKIKVVLSLEAKQFPTDLCLRRWLGEPVDALILPISLFEFTTTNEPSLPKKWLQLLKHFLHNKANIIFKTNHCDVDLNPFAKYLKTAINICLPDHHNKGYEDVLNIPQQPLAENLSCNIYEEYERDHTKYKYYQMALEAALKDRVVKEDKKRVLTVIMILGAGRGPLVRAALNAAENTQRLVRIYVIEKNINAVRVLKQIQMKLWLHKDIEIYNTDMRDFKPPEEADILVSELLGSFGDNELSPECLDCAQKFLKENGISIPSSYTSFINPIMSTILYNQIRQFESAFLRPFENVTPNGQDMRYSETAYVVMLQNVFNIAMPKSLFTFIHPKTKSTNHNRRYGLLTFEVPIDCVLNGIAGYFEAVLYKDIKLSINPCTHTVGLFSWFPMYFPLKIPINLKKDDIVKIHFWRFVSNTKIWYEWQVVVTAANSLSASQISPIHNRNGASYPIFCQ